MGLNNEDVGPTFLPSSCHRGVAKGTPRQPLGAIIRPLCVAFTHNVHLAEHSPIFRPRIHSFVFHNFHMVCNCVFHTQHNAAPDNAPFSFNARRFFIELLAHKIFLRNMSLFYFSWNGCPCGLLAFLRLSCYENGRSGREVQGLVKLVSL